MLTPTHANKKGRRYRYYVSHGLIAGRKPKANTSNPGGQPPRRRSSARRIPATDLEAIVEQRLIAFLSDAATIDAIVAPRAIDIEERRRLVAALAEFADNWPELPASEKIAVLKFLVSGIVVTACSVESILRLNALVELARHAHDWDSGGVARMGKRARLPSASEIHDGSTDEILILTVPAFLKRVGMEMRHLIGVTSSSLDRKPDRSLTRIIAQAHRFRDLMVRSNGRPFAEMADECGVTTSYFTRILRFAFLEPGILDAIVSGTQPVGLKAQKLSLLQTLPIEWQAQRWGLGFD